MWIQFSDTELAALKQLLDHADAASPEGHADAKQIADRIAWYEAPGANDQRYRDAVQTNDDLEIDDDAVTSVGNEGAFVMTWTYVSNEEAKIDPEDDGENGEQAMFGDPQPMGERGNSILKSNRVEGHNFID